MYSIFVQIASYRDPELIPTLHSLIDNAKSPELLTICVAHQHSQDDPWDTLDDFKNDSRFIVVDIPHAESRGTCWARNQIQQHYTNQYFTLQIDSHHRFAKNWDETCVNMFNDLQAKGHPRPLITAYLPSYVPENDPEERTDTAWGMAFDRFTPNGMVFFKPYYLEKEITEPKPARFYSGHFTFTIGDFCREVPHDPNLYFHGEEISISARAYSWGYDMFHPNKIIAWHEYTREGRSKHWDDNPNWSKQDESSQSRVKSLLKIDNQQCTPCAQRALKGFDMGPTRTLSSYEEYAGIKFKERSVQQATLDNELPGYRNDEYHTVFRYKISVDLKEDDYSFIAVIYEDQQGGQINRVDLLDKEIENLVKQKEIHSEFIGQTPYKYIVWPYTNEKGWGDRIEGLVS